MASVHGSVPRHVGENIQTLAELRERTAKQRTRYQRAVDRATRGLGRPLTVFSLLAGVGAWLAYNLWAPSRGWVQLDPPPFKALECVAAVYAALISTVVLATQNRDNLEAEQRALLEFQINLLAEQKTAKIIALIEELRHDIPGVSERRDTAAEALQEQVDPHAVASELENTVVDRS